MYVYVRTYIYRYICICIYIVYKRSTPRPFRGRTSPPSLSPATGAPPFVFFMCGVWGIQGYLTYTRTHPPITLP